MLIEVGFSGGQRGGGARLRWQCPGLVEGLWENGFHTGHSARRAVLCGAAGSASGPAGPWTGKHLGGWGATHSDCAGGTHESRHGVARGVPRYFSGTILSTLFSESTPTLHLPPAGNWRLIHTIHDSTHTSPTQSQSEVVSG